MIYYKYNTMVLPLVPVVELTVNTPGRMHTPYPADY